MSVLELKPLVARPADPEPQVTLGVLGLGFRGLGFRALGLGFRVESRSLCANNLTARKRSDRQCQSKPGNCKPDMDNAPKRMHPKPYVVLNLRP